MNDEPVQLSGPPEDDQVKKLRAALKREANKYEPSHRFAEIWETIERENPGPTRNRRRFRWLAAAVVAMIALGIAVPVVGLQLWQGNRDQRPASSPMMTNSAATIPTQDSSGSLPTMIRAVPVRYYGRTDGKLYRELHDLAAEPDKLTVAVSSVLNLAPDDPYYRSAWSGGYVNSARIDTKQPNLIVIDLSSSAFATMKSRTDLEAGLTELVWTAMDAVGDTSGAMKVRFLMDGDANLPHLGKPSQDFGRGPMSQLATVWVNAPNAGQGVAAGEVKISGQVQSTFKASRGNWRIASDDSKQQVASGGVTLRAVASPGWTGWAATTRLERGRYTFVTTFTNSEGATSEVSRSFVVN